MPIIDTRIGVIVLMSVSPARMNRRMNAVPTATSASAIGIEVATNVRKTIDEHDERGQEAEQLLYSLLDGRGLGLAVELGGDARRLDRVADGVFHGDDLRAICGLDRLRELRLRRMRFVRCSENVWSENGLPTLSMPALPSLALNSAVLSFATAASTAALRSGVSRRSPFGRGEDEVQHGALLGGELRLDQVGGLLRVRARDLELVA